MPADVLIRTAEYRGENGERFIATTIERRNKTSPLKNMMIAGAEIVNEVTFIASTWKSNTHPAWLLMISAMGAVSAIHFYINAQRHIRTLKPRQRYRLQFWWLAAGTITYFTSIHVLSKALKCSNRVWIPCLVFAAFGYQIAVTAVKELGTVMKGSPFMKCCELLFGPTLIGCAACYLKFRQHEEKWPFFLLMNLIVYIEKQILYDACQWVLEDHEPEYLFNGLEYFIAGSLLLVNSSMLVVYFGINKYALITFCLYFRYISEGIMSIGASIICFQIYADMNDLVRYYVFKIIIGPIIFVLACLGFRCWPQMGMLPLFIVAAGTDLYIFGEAVLALRDIVPEPVVMRYCQRVLGLEVTVISSLIAAFSVYKMGWSSSLRVMPWISAGIFLTYLGFRKRNRPGH